ncbi:MAG: hypothetical protein QOD32_2177 [Pyrinomonadaceae bacterium]|jgi:hypothetical protein|nr:hypothetical protein [Pyrinomonadaceae bacterium]
MFLRALVLTILIMCTVASTLPLSDTLAHWASRPSASRRHKGRSARRHSRAWWRRYRTRLRRQRAAAAERRRRRAAMMLTAAAAKPVALLTTAANHASAKIGEADSLVLPGVALPSTAALSSITPVKPLPAVVPATKDALQELPRPAASPLPNAWSSAASSRAGEMRFNVRAADGRVRSSAVWSRVNLAAADSSVSDARSKTFGGVPVALLRRTVINRMVAEGGWVTNDVQRQLGERRVFVVTAQSVAANGERRAWMFYFTESDGQVYSLATNAPAEFADALAVESEQAVVALGSRRANSATAQR